MLEFLAEGPGPLGVEPIGIVKLRAVNTPRCCTMHARRARSTCLHKKWVPGGLLGASVCCAFPCKPCPYRGLVGQSIIRPTEGDRRSRPTASRMNNLPGRLYDSVIYPQTSKSLCRKGCGPLGVGPYCVGHTSTLTNADYDSSSLSPCAEHLSTESGFPRILSFLFSFRWVPGGLLGASVCAQIRADAWVCPYGMPRNRWGRGLMVVTMA
jgi:hypothetical protein